MGMERRSRVVSDKEKYMVAVHEIGHTVVSWFLKHPQPVLKVSIVPRGSSSLGHTQQSPSTAYLSSREQLCDQMAVALGGRAAEQVVYGSITTGAEDDLRRVTQLAYNMIARLGMGQVC